MISKHLRHLVEQRERLLANRGLVGVKQHLLEDEDLLTRHAHFAVVGVWAAVVVVHAISRLGLRRAGIFAVGDAVAVGVGTSLQRRHTSHLGTGIVRVEDAVGVGVGHRAAIEANDAGDVDAGIHRVEHAISVVVWIGDAVVVVMAVLVLRIVRGAVVDVEHAVLVVVDVGAAVAVVEAVEVFGDGGALVVDV